MDLSDVKKLKVAKRAFKNWVTQTFFIYLKKALITFFGSQK